MNARMASFIALKKTIVGNTSFLSIKNHYLTKLSELDRKLFHEITQGTLRYFVKLDFILSKLITKKADDEIKIILLLSLYQMFYTRIEDFAIIFEAVEITKKIGRPFQKNFVNAVLRNALRKKAELLNLNFPEHVHFSHPEFLFKKIKKSYPDFYEQICLANNIKPNIYLRINRQKSTCEVISQELKHLDIKHEIINDFVIEVKQNIKVDDLECFKNGQISVQDISAQRIVNILPVFNGARVLDACSAPGSKTCAMLELANIDVISLESSKNRLDKVVENLNRLNLQATVINDDAQSQDWWDKNLFDCILIDVPCSGSGVINKHPDIKLHKNSANIDALTKTQFAILNNLWNMLKQKGFLLYCTCSIFDDENDHIIAKLLDEHTNVRVVEIASDDFGLKTKFGRQNLQGIHLGSGFYYCLLQKI